MYRLRAALTLVKAATNVFVFKMLILLQSNKVILICFHLIVSF